MTDGADKNSKLIPGIDDIPVDIPVTPIKQTTDAELLCMAYDNHTPSHYPDQPKNPYFNVYVMLKEGVHFSHGAMKLLEKYVKPIDDDDMQDFIEYLDRKFPFMIEKMIMYRFDEIYCEKYKHLFKPAYIIALKTEDKEHVKLQLSSEPANCTSYEDCFHNGLPIDWVPYCVIVRYFIQKLIFLKNLGSNLRIAYMKVKEEKEKIEETKDMK